MGPVKILLDTCTLLWLALEPERLSACAVQVIDDPASRLFLSDVSVWEIVLKHAAEKLPLPDPPHAWLPRQIGHWQLDSLPIAQSALYRSGTLPNIHHDLFDRLLAASAIESGLTVLSPDQPLSALGAARIW